MYILEERPPPWSLTVEGFSWRERPASPWVNTSWGPFGAFLGPFWGPLGPPGGVLGGFQTGPGALLETSQGGFEEKLPESRIWMRFATGLDATWAVLAPSWSRLGAVLRPSWAPFGPPWAFLGVVLGPLEALLGPSWNHLRHLKQIKENTEKHQQTLIRIAFSSPGESQDGPKMSPNWGHSGFQSVPKTILATYRAIWAP